MSQISTTFPDSTYTSSNLPSADTLKADIAAIETGANDTDSNAIKKDGSVAFTGNVVQGATPAAATHVATMGAIYPVGAVFLSVVSTDPSTLLGFGTWARIAEAQMLVGFKTGDADFGTVMGTGGAKTATLTTDELPAHTHTGPSHTHTATTSGQSATHTHGIAVRGTSQSTGSTSIMGDASGGTVTLNTGNASGDHTHTLTTSAAGTGATGSAGSGEAFSIINPYYTVYAWKRTA